MAESSDSFVKKLQSEGVDAGKKAAEEIKKDARHPALLYAPSIESETFDNKKSFRNIT